MPNVIKISKRLQGHKGTHIDRLNTVSAKPFLGFDGLKSILDAFSKPFISYSQSMPRIQIK